MRVGGSIFLYQRSRKIIGMPPDSPTCGSARSAATINAEIRAFWLRLDGRVPTAVERAEYEALVAEWAAAVRGEVTEAA